MEYVEAMEGIEDMKVEVEVEDVDQCMYQDWDKVTHTMTISEIRDKGPQSVDISDTQEDITLNTNSNKSVFGWKEQISDMIKDVNP